MYSLKTSNQILKPFSLSGSYTILVFITFGGGTRALNTGGIGKIAMLEHYLDLASTTGELSSTVSTIG